MGNARMKPVMETAPRGLWAKYPFDSSFRGPKSGPGLLKQEIHQDPTYGLHGSSFWGLPFRILNVDLVKTKKGNTTMETIGILYVYPHLCYVVIEVLPTPPGP